LVESSADSWRFYVVHEQGERGSTASGSGVFFRDLTLEHLSADQDDISGRYFLQNTNSWYVADVDAASTDDGGDILQWSFNGNENQLWQLVQNADGTYRIESVNSGKVMDVEGASTADGANVVQWSWQDGANQKWNVVLNSDGTYRLENVNSGKVLDVAGSSSSEADSLVQNGWTGADSQKW
ncbi:hypothetical protein C5B89_19055, partial [Haloferax sp. Atlit-47N]|uniref:RICIN domain-containing protein n=1 Tax=Haloferax sp. Atlit-47N TaxID=2077199 RepID=UPI000E3AA08E